VVWIRRIEVFDRTQMNIEEEAKKNN